MLLTFHVTVFLACAAVAIVATVLTGPVLSRRFGLHALWIAPAIAAVVVQLIIAGFGLWISLSMNGESYLDKSIKIGAYAMPLAASAAILTTLFAMLLRRTASRTDSFRI